MEENSERIDEILERVKEEGKLRQLRLEEKRREKKMRRFNKERAEEELRRLEEEKKDRLWVKRKLEERWGMIKW